MRIKSNFRVVCLPDSGLWGEEAKEKHAQQLQIEIKRHCDTLAKSYIEYDWVCSFCEDNYKNSLDEKTGCPLCCNKALKEWEAEQAIAKAKETK